MYSFSLPRLVIVALHALSVLRSSAQDGGEVALRFLSFPKAIDPQPVELLLGDGKVVEVEIPSNELSKAYKVPRMDAWVIGQSATGEDGKPAFEVFGKADSLASHEQLILLIRKGPNNPDGMEVIPVNNAAANFGGGRFLFMNAAKVDIAGEAGGVKFAIKPGAHAITSPKAEAGARTFHAMFFFRKNDEAVPFFSSKWPVSDRARGLIFFYHQPETGRLRMHTIRDFP